MSYVQTPSSSRLSQAREPDASGVVSGAIREALMRVDPSSMPRTAPPDRISSSMRPLLGLSVGRVLPVLALEVLADQAIREPRRRRIEGPRDERHPRQLLEHGGVIDGLLWRLTPGESTVAGHQHHGGGEGIAVAEALQ